MTPALTFGGKSSSRLLTIAACLLLWAMASACQAPVPPATPTPSEAPTRVVAAASTSAQTGVERAWEDSKHAATFVTEDGNNNDCARCHSPLNWMPTSPADMPATCASCKFKVSTPKPIQKAEWKAIGCEICHRVKDQTVAAQISWLNSAIAQYDTSRDPYEDVKSATELCEKCHTNFQTWQYKVDVGGTAHATLQCTGCHDPHSMKANCGEKCHTSALDASTGVPGHDAAHKAVSCVPCHDASGMKVGPVPGQEKWLTFRPTDARGKANPTPWASHNLQRQVDCARCHFSGNQWGLKTDKSYSPAR